MATNKSFIPKEAVETLEKLNTALEKNVGALNSVFESLIKVQDAYSKPIISQKQMTETAKEQAEVQKEANKIIKEQKKIIDEYAKIQEKTTRAQEKANNTTSESIEYERAAMKATKEFIKSEQDKADSLIKLSNVMKSDAKDAVGQLGYQMKQLYEKKENLKDAMANLYSQIRSGTGDIEAQQAKYNELSEILVQTSEDYNENQKAIKQNNKILNAHAGSLELAQAMHAKLTTELAQMSRAGEGMTGTFKEMSNQANLLKVEIEQLKIETGHFTHEAGRYDTGMRDITLATRIMDYQTGMLLHRVQQIVPIKRAWIAMNLRLQKSLGITARAATFLQAALVGAVIGAVWLAVRVFREWQDEADLATRANESFNESLRNGTSSANAHISNIIRMRAMMNNMHDTFNNGAKILAFYNRNLADTMGELDNFEDAKKRVNEQGDALIKIMIRQALGQEIIEQGVRNITSAIAQQNGTLKENTGWWQRFFAGFGILNPIVHESTRELQRLLNTSVIEFDRATREKELIALANAEKSRAISDKEARGIEINMEEINEIYNKRIENLDTNLRVEESKIIEHNRRVELANKAWERSATETSALVTREQAAGLIFRNMIDGERNKQKYLKETQKLYGENLQKIMEYNNGLEINYRIHQRVLDSSQRSMRQMREMNVRRIRYERQRHEVAVNLIQNELDKQRTTAEGILQDYAKRKQAVSDFYRHTQELADLDLGVAIQNSNYQLSVELDRIRRAREANTEAHNAVIQRLRTEARQNAETQQAILDAETRYAQAQRANRVAEANARANNYDRVQRLTDEHYQQRIRTAQSYRESLHSIRNEMLQDELDFLQRRQRARAGEMRRERIAIEAEVNYMNAFEVLAAGFGAQRDDRFARTTAQHNIRIKQLADAEEAILREVEASKQLYGEMSVEVVQAYVEIEEARRRLYEFGGTDEERQELEDRLQMLNEYIEELGGISERQIDWARQLAEAQMNINDELLEYNLMQTINIENKKRELQIQTAKETRAMIDAIVSRSFFRQREELNKYVRYHNRRIDDQLRSEVISREQADAQKWALQEYQERRDLEMRQRQARLARAQAVFEIGINTAAAIMNQLRVTPFPVGAPFVAMISAMGAVQLATALATPIPRYAKGTDNHKGGLAIVGDGGKSEMGILPSGKIFKTDRKPQLLDLPARTKILPDFDKALLSLPRTDYWDKRSNVVVVNDYKDLEMRSAETNKLLKKLVRRNHTPIIINNRGLKDKILLN